MEPNLLVCNFCGRTIKTREAFYESKAYRVFAKGVVDSCGDTTSVLSCERCEVLRMRATCPR